MRALEALAKINLGLVVGPVRSDGKHEVVTVLQRIGLADVVEVELAPDESGILVEGFEDTIVRSALEAFAEGTGIRTGWRVRIDKRIPLAAGLGGGSADAAAALWLANEISGDPLSDRRLHEVAAAVGSDVPFFLEDGARLATADGSELAPLEVPHDVPVVVVLPTGERKESTAAVYAGFDERGGATGFAERREAMLAAVARATTVADLASLPGNDLASSPVACDLERLGAFRADVSGAGPAVYGLFEDEHEAVLAARTLRSQGTTWLTRTVPGG
jgi:4-diphosphocytidyl-2-C-methyl-D-erythritol kinase